MHSMDRVTDEDEEVAKDSLSKRANSGVHFDSDEETVKQHRDGLESEIFETHLVVTFANTINQKALHWIVDKIRSKRSHGGAELLIRMEPQTELVEKFNKVKFIHANVLFRFVIALTRVWFFMFRHVPIVSYN